MLWKEKLECQWQIEWAEELMGRHIFSLQTSLKSKRWKLNSGRRNDIVLTKQDFDFGIVGLPVA